MDCSECSGRLGYVNSCPNGTDVLFGPLWKAEEEGHQILRIVPEIQHRHQLSAASGYQRIPAAAYNVGRGRVLGKWCFSPPKRRISSSMLVNVFPSRWFHSDSRYREMYKVSILVVRHRTTSETVSV